MGRIEAQLSPLVVVCLHPAFKLDMRRRERVYQKLDIVNMQGRTRPALSSHVRLQQAQVKIDAYAHACTETKFAIYIVLYLRLGVDGMGVSIHDLLHIFLILVVLHFDILRSTQNEITNAGS